MRHGCKGIADVAPIKLHSCLMLHADLQVLRELRALAEELGVEDRVVFLKNVTESQR